MLPSWEEPESRSLGADLAEQLLDQRVIVLGGRLDDAAANRAAAQLLLLSRRSGRTPIELNLACPEAELSAALALADTVELAAPPVHAVIRGTLAGAAIAVLCAAEERAAPRHALLVLSMPRTSAEGTAAQLANLAEHYERQVTRLRDTIVATSGRSAEDVTKDLENGRVLSGEEAFEYGLVNRLL
ncbi:MAG: ATP-dependent Clp protease proteolytic subunit [Jiangellaceae bacterium]|nr:ATP-dependent Clp protease proteolytic subunit [Jiangellaceae bacterium]